MADERGRAFEQAAAARVYAPPRRGTPPAQQPAPQGVPPKRKTNAQLRAEKLRLQKRVVGIMLAAALLLGGPGTLIYMRAHLVENAKESQALSTTLAAKKSEKIELEMKIASYFSLDRVEKIAKEKLGMVEYREQFHYVLSQSGDKLSVN